MNLNNYFTKGNQNANFNFHNEFNLKTNQDPYYNYTQFNNRHEETNKDDYLLEKINKQNDDCLLERQMSGNIKKRFRVNKMKQKFDEERKVRSIIKNKSAVESFSRLVKNNSSNRLFSDSNADKNLVLYSNLAKNKNSSDNNINILNSRNEEISEFCYDSPPPNINLNKMPLTSNKFYSMNDRKKNYSNSNSINTPPKIIKKTLSSTINKILKNNKGGKQVFDPVHYIQRNLTGNPFLKSNSNKFYELMNSNRNGIDAYNNSNFDMEEYFNLMNLNNPKESEESSSTTDFNILNKYLSNDVKAKKDLNDRTQQSFNDCPNKRNQIFSENEMRKLNILKKLAFKGEQRKIIYETDDSEY